MSESCFLTLLLFFWQPIIVFCTNPQLHRLSGLKTAFLWAAFWNSLGLYMTCMCEYLAVAKNSCKLKLKSLLYWLQWKWFQWLSCQSGVRTCQLVQLSSHTIPLFSARICSFSPCGFSCCSSRSTEILYHHMIYSLVFSWLCYPFKLCWNSRPCISYMKRCINWPYDMGTGRPNVLYTKDQIYPRWQWLFLFPLKQAKLRAAVLF